MFDQAHRQFDPFGGESLIAAKTDQTQARQPIGPLTDAVALRELAHIAIECHEYGGTGKSAERNLRIGSPLWQHVTMQNDRMAARLKCHSYRIGNTRIQEDLKARNLTAHAAAWWAMAARISSSVRVGYSFLIASTE